MTSLYEQATRKTPFIPYDKLAGSLDENDPNSPPTAASTTAPAPPPETADAAKTTGVASTASSAGPSVDSTRPPLVDTPPTTSSISPNAIGGGNPSNLPPLNYFGPPPTIPGNSGAAPSGVDLVDERLQKMWGRNSPLIEQAQTAALQSANSRGVPFSSMASEAVTEGTIKSMLPIASQDSGAINQMTMTDKQIQGQKDIAQAQIGAQMAIASANLQAANQQFQSQLELTRQGWDRQDKTNATNFEHNMDMFNRQLAASRSDTDTARLFAMQQQYNQSILALQTSPELTPEQRGAQIGALNTLYGGITYSGQYLNLVAPANSAGGGSTTRPPATFIGPRPPITGGH